jgi:replication factor A1
VVEMAISDLQPRQGNVELEAEVVEIGEIREFEKFGKLGRVANAIIKDGTGQVKLSLWNEQIDQVKPGDRVKITNGYVSEWQGEMQLTTGKFGKLEIVGKDEESPQEEPEAKEVPKEEVSEEEPAEEEAPAEGAPEEEATEEPEEEKKEEPAEEETEPEELDLEEEKVD